MIHRIKIFSCVVLSVLSTSTASHQPTSQHHSQPSNSIFITEHLETPGGLFNSLGLFQRRHWPWILPNNLPPVETAAKEIALSRSRSIPPTQNIYAAYSTRSSPPAPDQLSICRKERLAPTTNFSVPRRRPNRANDTGKLGFNPA